jgi:hypothetical protein
VGDIGGDTGNTNTQTSKYRRADIISSYVNNHLQGSLLIVQQSKTDIILRNY